MKAEDIFKLLNKGKRLNHIEPVKPKKYTLKTILMSYTGKVVKKMTEYISDTLKGDLTIQFKPVKPFRRKDLKALSKFDIAERQRKADEVRGTPTLHDTKLNEPTLKKNEKNFINWFELDEKTEKKEKNNSKVITLKKEDGTVVGLGTFEDKF